MIEIGKKAPAFSLESSAGETRTLADYAGKYLVLYFYPRDNTPGCTTEAIEFTRQLPELTRLGAVVAGVSKDSIGSHQKFIDKHQLGVELLSDPGGEMLEAYGAWGEKLMYGKKKMGIIRSTAVVDPDGAVLLHYPKVRARGHAEAVLGDLAAALGVEANPAGGGVKIAGGKKRARVAG